MVRGGLHPQPASHTHLSLSAVGRKFAGHFRQLGQLEVNWSGPFHPQFAVCRALRAFSLPQTFWHLPNVMLKHRASRRLLPEPRGDGLIGVSCLLEEPEASALLGPVERDV